MSEKSNINDANDLLSDRAIRLFTYLKEVAQLRTKVVRDCSEYEDILWFNDIPMEKGCYSIAWGSKSEDFDNTWIEIRKFKEPQCPSIPSICSDWVNPKAVFDSDNEPKLNDRIPKIISDENYEYLYLQDKPEVSKAWGKYIKNSWYPWAEKHRIWKSVQSIYGKLFSMYNQQKKLGETNELILGLGLLIWISPSDQRIKRHLLAGQANISFDPNTGVIRVVPSPDGTKLSLETDMLEPSERPTIEVEQALEDNLKETSETPWDRQLVEPIIRGWINAIDPKGLYSESLEVPNEFKHDARAFFAPALILRKRTTRNLVSAFNKIINQIQQGQNIPFNIKRVCEITGDRTPQDESQDSSQKKRDTPREIYFPLPSNDEQSQIANRLHSNQGILVQGPPGTGKSHTIANLICHLLANGKRVLVTSQTPRALRVLSEKIPKDILPLCVNVLGNDISSFQNLEYSVRNITERYNDWNDVQNKKDISKLEDQIYSLKSNRADTERKLRELREIETYKHTIAGGKYTGTAQSMAKRVAEESSDHNWFLDEINDSISMPLDLAAFKKLLNLYRELPASKCKEISHPVVKSKDLPSVEKFLKLIKQEREARELLLKHESRKSNPSYLSLFQAEKDPRKKLEESLNNLILAVDGIKKRPLQWIPQAINDVLTEHEQPWQKLYDTTKENIDVIREKVELVEKLSVTLPNNISYQQIYADAEDILKHINLNVA